MIRITVAGRPRGKPRAVPFQGGAYLSKNTKEWSKLIADEARLQMAGRPLLEGPVKIEIWAIFDIPTSWNKVQKAAAEAGRQWHTGKPDTDNICKLVADSCKEIVWYDDAQVAVEIVQKRYGTNARVEIVITPLEQPEGAIPWQKPSPKIKRAKHAPPKPTWRPRWKPAL